MLKYTWRLLAGYCGVLKLGVRSTSSKNGWLRLVIQCFFAIITVASFIMIVIMSMQRTATYHTIKVSRMSKCSDNGCKIICNRITSHSDDEYDIIKTVLELTERCPSMNLDLVEPLFRNGTIPKYWMVNLEAPITSLRIFKGNLHHIEPYAFFGSFFKNVEALSLVHVTLTEWTSVTFLGLQNLKILKIIESNLKSVERNVLWPHRNTLKALKIEKCNEWIPENITGTSELQYVDRVGFSGNNFGLLSKTSFTQLNNCDFLDLSSSGIVAIEEGTLDYLEKITIINLSYNKLVTLPIGLLDRVIGWGNLYFHIHLHGNPWNCNCHLEQLIHLNDEGIIANDPKCAAPENKMGRYFSSFYSFCSNESSNNSEISENQFPVETIFLTDSCTLTERKIVSPVRRHSCSREVARVIERDLDDLSLTLKAYSRHVNPLFFISDEDYTMLELKTTVEYGLVWYSSFCPNTIFCIETLPQNVKLYNINQNTTYIMCPIDSEGHIKDLSCIKYSARGFNIGTELSPLRMLFYVLAILIGIGFGAVALYGIIRKNPALLKGSKRILLVKHKAADALVLPPKISVRFEELEENHHQNFLNISKVNPHILKSFSTRSSKSNAPSYISALQPTEDQLKQWRLKHHFDTGSLYSTISSTERSRISCIYEGDVVYSLKVDKTSETCSDI